MIIVINDVNKGLICIVRHNPKAQLETRFRRNLDVILFHLFFYSLFVLYECILGHVSQNAQHRQAACFHERFLYDRGCQT